MKHSPLFVFADSLCKVLIPFKSLMCYIIPRDAIFRTSPPPNLLHFQSMLLFERCVVLIADDEPGILRLASHALTRHGYIVIPAPDGLSALRACREREGPIHLALLDVRMPGMSGPEL